MADEITAAQPEVGAAPAKTTFGLTSFGLPTPENARQGFKLFLLVNTLIVITINGFPQIPIDVKNLILQFSTVANLLANKLEDYFGLSDLNVK